MEDSKRRHRGFAFVAPISLLLTAIVMLGETATKAQSSDVTSTLPARDSMSRVHALFDLTTPDVGPFPSDQFTVADASQLTGRRVNLPRPDCSVRPSDCADIDEINTLDGFNLLPRLTVSFDGPIDPSTVNSQNVLLVAFSIGEPRAIGINEMVWSPDTNQLYVESDENLDQHSIFAIVVTNALLDTSGRPVARTRAFHNFLNHGSGDYHDRLLDGIRAANAVGIPTGNIVTASVFVTLSATAVLEKMRDQVNAGTPDPASFVHNGLRTVYPLDSVSSMVINQQTQVSPPGFTPATINLGNLHFVPGAIGTLAFGSFDSPNYLVPQSYIPQISTLTGTPVVQGTNHLEFDLTLPTGTRPSTGWPIVIFGHGGGGSKELLFNVAAKYASYGFATIGININGHGFGELSTVRLTLNDGGMVTFSAGGRGFDADGNNMIDVNEGYNSLAPNPIIRNRDSQRQAAVDLLQMIRVIQVGMDVDGDGNPDIDASQIYFSGLSQGAHYGAELLALSPDLVGGVLSSGGSPQMEIRRMSPSARGNQAGFLCAVRTPSLINSNGLTEFGGIPVQPPFFNENKPFRDEPILVNDVPGALAIQALFENVEWVNQQGEAGAFAPHIRKMPLTGVAAKPVIIQFAKTDQSLPNPEESAFVRAGDFADVTTYLRNDLLFADNPNVQKDPHTFLVRIRFPADAPQAAAAQDQAGAFFASRGTIIIHPEPSQYWEVPIQSLPEDLSFIP
jgi:hypothetical protein